MQLKSIASLLLAALLASCGTNPASAPAGSSASKVDEFSRRVQIAIQQGKLESKSVALRLPDGRNRVITASGWTDQ